MARSNREAPFAAPLTRSHDGAHERSHADGAATLVGRTFRCAMSASLTGDPAPLILAWQAFANAAGQQPADRLTGDMAAFVDALRTSAGRRIECFPAGCPGFCRDECLAISIIAAAQHSVCPAMKACVFALIASSQTERAIDAASTLAASLREAGQLLSSTSVCNAAALTPNPVSVRAS